MNILVTTIGLTREGKTTELLEHVNNICKNDEDNNLNLIFFTTEESIEGIQNKLKNSDKVKVIFINNKFEIIEYIKNKCVDNSSVVFIDNIDLLELRLEELDRLISNFQFDCYCTITRI